MIAPLIVLSVICTAFTSELVSTSLGDIRGVQLKSRLGQNFYAFRGIRYGIPPVGELRFEPPQPVDPWKPNVFDATKDGPRCPQGEYNSTQNSEDCLRLNVYSRDLKGVKPVIIYIHPGAFYGFSGISEDAGPELMMDRDIVFVTINYRLGTLGLLATGTVDAPGNAAMKDQVAAFKWVQKHIHNFGGDPKSVTLLGYSAGATSVGLHMVSPMSKGLFHKGIAMSASPVSQKPYSEDQLDLAKKQASLVNCPINQVKEMVKCLKKIPYEEFLKTFDKMFEFGYNPMLNWMPVIEKDFGQERFIIEEPLDSFQSGKIERVPLIVGMTKDEFARIAYYILRNDNMTKQLNDEWDRVAPITLLYERNTPKSRKASSVLRRDYMHNEPFTSDSFEPFAKLFSDAVIGFPVHRFAHLAARYVPVHYYRFSYKGRFSDFIYPETKAPYGTVHHDDLLYLLQIPRLAPLFKKTDPEDATVERLTRMWTNFAETGDPNNLKDEYLKNLNWQPLDLEKENFLEIGNELVLKENLFLERFHIWSKLFPLKWNGYNLKPNELEICEKL